MKESRPLVAILWNIVWLVMLGSIALWLAGEVLSQMWGWLVLAAVLFGAIGSLLIWWRKRQDRW